MYIILKNKNMRYTGTVVRGIRTPVIKYGDDLNEVVLSSILRASKAEKFSLKNRDIVGVTESVVSICQNNYVTIEEVAEELRKKYEVDEIGIVFPILSRNRFSLILTAITKAFKKVHILFSYPSDEVGNQLMDPEKMESLGINQYTSSFGESKYRKLFGKEVKHEFTGIDYVNYYKSIGDGNVVAHFSNRPEYILKFTKNVLVCDIHTRARSKKILKEKGGEKVYGLDEICNRKNSKKGYNKEYGLLGSNRMGEDRLKLFPRDGEDFANALQKRLKKETGKNIEVLIYGDGAFKDPVGKIWELADPVVSPGFTDGLRGRPKEIKLKYVSENWDKKGNLDDYVKQMIKEKNTEKYVVEKSLGTTPRQLTDLLGSLCDLTSGSGDKGTPVILIQGYFDDYTAE
jgi:F420-0:gamma-glutamyl ligase